MRTFPPFKSSPRERCMEQTAGLQAQSSVCQLFTAFSGGGTARDRAALYLTGIKQNGPAATGFRQTECRLFAVRGKQEYSRMFARSMALLGAALVYTGFTASSADAGFRRGCCQPTVCYQRVSTPPVYETVMEK